MNFLFPQFLFGLFAVSIPIIIHLFNLQKPKKILFPNIRFLKKVEQTTTNTLKIKHLLILLARICAVVFLVLAFAQPVWITGKEVVMKGQSIVSMYLDNSFSMQNELAQEKILDVGIKSAQQLTTLFPSGSKYVLLTNDFEGRDQYLRNKDKLNERLSELGFSGNYRSGEAIMKRQSQQLTMQGKDAGHVVWFSDFQKSTLGDLSKLKFDSSLQYHFVPLNTAEISNIYIDSLWLKNPLIKSGENNTIEVKVANAGTKEVRELLLKLYIDNIQVSASSVDISPNNTVVASFTFNISGEGQKKASIRFEDYPIIFDNEYFFTLTVSPKITILHLYDLAGDYISQVYGNESIFQATNNRLGDFDYSRIASSNLIVLDEPQNISTALYTPIQEFVSRGGSLLLIPSTAATAEYYKGLCSVLGLPAPVFMPLDTSFRASAELMPPDFNNPFFASVFDKKDNKMNMPFAFPTVDWGGKGEPLLRYKNGKHFLSKIDYDKGTIYTLASSLQEPSSNLARHSIFVAIMYKIAFNSLLTSEKLGYTFQDKAIPIELPDSSVSDKKEIITLEGEGRTMVPAQWYNGNTLMIDLPDSELKPGYYTLSQKGKIIKTIALNHGKEESIANYYTVDELKKITGSYKNVKIYEAESEEQFSSLFKQENMGIPLWKYMLVGVLFFLLIEIAFIRLL